MRHSRRRRARRESDAILPWPVRLAQGAGHVSRRVELALLGCLVVFGCSRQGDVTSGAVGGLSGGSAAPVVRAPDAHASARVSVSAHSEPILVGGQASGYLRLADGLVIRTAKEACPSTRPRLVECRATKRGCKTDAECTAKPNGYCTDVGDNLGCGCHYGCLTDGDCLRDEICLCGEPVGSCIKSSCVNESCAAPSQCATYYNGCLYTPFTCLEHAGSATCSF